jgi:hypothetical protein
MGRREIHTGYWWKSQKRPLGKDLDVGGRIILNWILENRMEWYGLN